MGEDGSVTELRVTTRTVPPGTGRRRPGRREELVQAALEVIRRDGPGASMDEMAAEAGITKPVLYRYFGDREGLVAAVAERFTAGLVGRLRAALEPVGGTPPEAVIHDAIESYVGFIEEDPALYGFLTRQAPPDSPALVAVIEEVAGVIAEVIRTAFAAAGLDARPAETWAHGVVGMVHLAGAAWARDPGVTRTQLVDDLSTLVAHGLLGAAEPVQPTR